MNRQQVTFIATRRGTVWIGEVIDVLTHQTLYRTGAYASEETAKSAATSLWRAKCQQAAA